MSDLVEQALLWHVEAAAIDPVMGSRFAALADALEEAERENERLREALGQIANAPTWLDRKGVAIAALMYRPPSQRQGGNRLT